MKRIFAAMTAALLMVALVSSAAFATTTINLMTGAQQWRVYNAKPATAAFWDINKAKLTNGTLQFPVQQFDTTTTGSFVIYLLNNYNVSLTASQTLSADMNWTAGTYKTRSDPGAYVRFEFQDVTAGPFTSNDYWWSTGTNSLDLNAVSSGTLSVSLADRTLWTNICGQSATDTTAHPGPNCVGGTDPAVSPYDGFTTAMKNVKQLGLSFGNASRYASGVALDGASGTFQMTSFTITQ